MGSFPAKRMHAYGNLATLGQPLPSGGRAHHVDSPVGEGLLMCRQAEAWHKTAQSDSISKIASARNSPVPRPSLPLPFPRDTHGLWSCARVYVPRAGP